MPNITVPLSLSFLMSSNTQSFTSLLSPSKPFVENLTLVVVWPITSDSSCTIFVEFTASIWSLYDTKPSTCWNSELFTKTGEWPDLGTTTKMVNSATHSATNRESKVWNLGTEKLWRMTSGICSCFESKSHMSIHRHNIIASVTIKFHNQEDLSLLAQLGPVDPLDCGGGKEKLELEAMVKTSRN